MEGKSKIQSAELNELIRLGSADVFEFDPEKRYLVVLQKGQVSMEAGMNLARDLERLGIRCATLFTYEQDVQALIGSICFKES